MIFRSSTRTFAPAAMLAALLWLCLGAGPVQAQETSSPTATVTSAITSTLTSTVTTTTYTQVTAGEEHTCALTSEGSVRCWGLNTWGQLGDDTNLTRNVPVETALSFTNVVSLEAGGRGTFALTADGRLWEWGLATIFIGSLSPTPYTELPGTPSGVSASSSHFCAVIAGEAFCYGLNFQGALGDGTTDFAQGPVKVAALDEPVSHIAAGGNYTCAVLASGAVSCWGANWSGTLGNGTTESSLVPVSVRGLSGSAADVEADDYFACALLESGSVECWGAMESLQSTAAPVAGLSKPVENLSVGAESACAVSGGAVQCWGANAHGELGRAPSDPIWRPVTVEGLPSPALSVSVGDTHACALLADGSLACWGGDKRGQLGRSNQVERAIPVPVVQPLTATQVSVGGTIYMGYPFTCAVFGAEGALRCWGGNQHGALGLGEDIVSVARPTLVPGLESGVRKVATGLEHACALTAAGDVYCWGAGWRGQVGSGAGEPQFNPRLVSGLGETATDLVAGGNYACVLLADGSVRCWGDVVPGIVRGREADYSLAPVTPAGLESGVERIAGGGGHACALKQDGELLCWGQNYSAQVGTGAEGSDLVAPSRVALDESPLSLALGDSFSCALLPKNEVRCWGRDYSVWITRGSSTTTVLTPTVVSLLPDAIQAIAAGSDTFCTLDAGGALWCLGDNSLSNLGQGSAASDTRDPAPVTGLEAGVESVSVGQTHSCAILEGGALWCWGSDGDGELGLGTKTAGLAPQTVSSAKLPSVLANATTATPDSILTLSAFNFPAGQDVRLLANGTPLTTTTPLTTSAAGTLALYLDTADAEPGYYLLTLAVSATLTSTAPITTSLDLILTDTAPLLAQLGAGLPTAALSAAEALDPSLAPHAQEVILLSIKAGANIRKQPNGEVLRAAAANTQLPYDAATAASIASPVEVIISANGEELSLLGQKAGQYLWVPVLVDGATAWVGDIVILAAAIE